MTDAQTLARASAWAEWVWRTQNTETILEILVELAPYAEPDEHPAVAAYFVALSAQFELANLPNRMAGAPT